jgi:hypothetical protein
MERDRLSVSNPSVSGKRVFLSLNADLQAKNKQFIETYILVSSNEMQGFYYEFEVPLSATVVIASQLIKPTAFTSFWSGCISEDFIYYHYAKIKRK